MIQREPDGADGWRASLRSTGVLRYFTAAFLGGWLCAWAFGEYFAFTLIASAVRAWLGPDVLSGWLPGGVGKLPPPGALPFFFAFITLWLTMWTFGGFMALSQMLTMLFGRELIRWGPDGLDIERIAVFPVSASKLAPHEITRFRTSRQGLVADRNGRVTRVAQLGTAADREELRTTLEAWRATFAPAQVTAPGQSPAPGWVVALDEVGALALEQDPRSRHTMGAVLMAFAMGFIGVAAAVSQTAHGAALVVGMLMLGGPGLVCLYAATWLLAVRESLRPRSGTLERRRTGFGRTWSREFTPLGLELRAGAESEDGARWTLVLTGGGKEQVLASAIGSPEPPLSLGQWFADRTGVELVRKGNENSLKAAS